MSLRLIRLAATCSVLSAFPASAQSNASVGQTVLQRMHDAYAGKWYKSLTFVQKTTTWDSTRTPQYETWYETVADHDGRVVLRIDRGSPTGGNGVLYTADSVWSMRGGKLVAARPTGNPFLPLIQGVYVQPVGKTVRELKGTGVDLSKGYQRSYDGANVTVVGAASAADSTSPQIWVDDARNVLVRMILSFAPGRPPIDVHLAGYERIGPAWLATRVTMYANGTPTQVEEYSNWKVDQPLSPQLFDVTRWTTAPHWAPKP
jgi:outer membrane lipoprotein-sorting protein